jgi:hypothetical protein
MRFSSGNDREAVLVFHVGKGVKDLRINYFHSVLYTHIMSSGTPI